MSSRDVPSMDKKKSEGGLMEHIKTIVYAGLIALGIRTLAYEPFNIPSESMLPTLKVGDYLFVSKWTYGYSHHSLPLSGYLPRLMRGRIFERQIDRGDVVVFKLPLDNSTDYIKRIVGLPGDRIKVMGGVLHINDQPVKRERLQDYADFDQRNQSRKYMQFRETLPNGVSYTTLDEGPNRDLDNTPEYTVPPGSYFAMGDNRDNSVDSRVPPSLRGVGFIPAENIVGRADLMFFSTNGEAALWEVWKWPFTVRWERLFTLIR